MAYDIDFKSPLPADEALARLRDHVGGDVPVLMIPISDRERPLRGRVSENAFSLRAKTAHGNSFAIVCRGSVDAVDGGSQLRAHFELPGPTLVFFVVWMMIMFGTVLAAVVDRDAKRGFEALGFLALGAALFSVARFLGRHEKQQLERQLRGIVDATSGPQAA